MTFYLSGQAKTLVKEIRCVKISQLLHIEPPSFECTTDQPMADTMLGFGHKSVEFTLALTKAELLRREQTATATPASASASVAPQPHGAFAAMRKEAMEMFTPVALVHEEATCKQLVLQIRDHTDFDAFFEGLSPDDGRQRSTIYATKTVYIRDLRQHVEQRLRVHSPDAKVPVDEWILLSFWPSNPRSIPSHSYSNPCERVMSGSRGPGGGAGQAGSLG